MVLGGLAGRADSISKYTKYSSLLSNDFPGDGKLIDTPHSHSVKVKLELFMIIP